MTTTNNYENLIEQVGGIEKARGIVEGATFGTHYRVDTGRIIYCPNENHFFFADQVKLGVEFIRIDDLRTAIAKHDEDHCNHEWNDMTSNGDKYRSLVCKNCDSTKNYLPLDEDHITDIRNHISPRTVVWDLASGEDWSVNHG